MSTVTLNEQITPINNIINKDVAHVTFKETISLFFHAGGVLAKETTDPDYQEWHKLYQEFEDELAKQNVETWPRMVIIKNDYNKRIDISTTNKPFVESKNIFMLMLRLLYVENYKRPYVFKSYNYHKIVGHKFHNVEGFVKNLSLNDIYNLLVEHLKYYVKIYDDEDHFEHQLGKTILEQL